MRFSPFRKCVAALATLAAAGALAVGCTSSTQPSEGEVPSEPVTLTYADGLLANPRSEPLIKAILEQFNESHENITVEPASIPFNSFAQTIYTQLSSGEGPDIIRFDSPDYYNAARAGALLDLTDVIDADEFDLVASSDEYTFVDGVRYGVVATGGNYVLLYNTDLVSDPPTTWEEFVEVAKAQTGDGRYGLAFRQTEPEANGLWQDIYQYVYGFGGEWSDGSTLTIDKRENIEGLERYQELYDAAVIPVGATASEYRQMFADGKVAMEIDNGGTADNLIALNPDLNLGAVTVPFPTNVTGGVVAMYGINASSRNTAAAQTFLKWMLSPEVQTQILNVSGTGGMVATDAEPTAEMVDSFPLSPVYAEAAKTSVPQLVVGFEDQTPTIREIVVRGVVAALQGQKTMEQAMRDAQAEAERELG